MTTQKMYPPDHSRRLKTTDRHYIQTRVQQSTFTRFSSFMILLMLNINREPERQPFYVQNKKDYLESLEKNCKKLWRSF